MAGHSEAVNIFERFYHRFCWLEHKLRFKLPLSVTTRWRLGRKSEVDFWDEYFRTKGGEWPETYVASLDPERPLQPEAAELLPKDRLQFRILDVGAGPLTFLGKKHGRAVLNITAVDPLAEDYDRILRAYGVVPVVRTQNLAAERLCEKFQPDSFDLVCARNCIDHSYSPESAILQMLTVTREGCYVLLVHRQNEAVHAHYEGLHQWNLATENNDFIISSRKERVNFTEKYKHLCEVRCRVDAEGWLYTTMLKKPSADSATKSGSKP
jgi:SAM-dependent methyltransferase